MANVLQMHLLYSLLSRTLLEQQTDVKQEPSVNSTLLTLHSFDTPLFCPKGVLGGCNSMQTVFVNMIVRCR